MIKGGVLAGALSAFIMSWINVEHQYFSANTGTYTLPVLLYNFLEYSITTAAIVAAAMGIYVAPALVLLIDGFIRHRHRGQVVGATPVLLLEHEGKAILREYGISTPPGMVVDDLAWILARRSIE